MARKTFLAIAGTAFLGLALAPAWAADGEGKDGKEAVAPPRPDAPPPKANREGAERQMGGEGRGQGGVNGEGRGGPPWMRNAEFRGRPEPVDPVRQGIANLNVADRAALGAAWALFETNKREEAVAAAAKVAEATPDIEASGYARLLMGRFYLEMEKPDRAREMLQVVKGPAAALALKILIEHLAADGGPDAVSAAYQALLAAQPDVALERARVLQALLDWLDGPGRERLEAEGRAKVLQAVAGSVSREQALAAKEALAKERDAAEAAERAGNRNLPHFEVFMGGEGGPGGPPGRDMMKDRLKDLKDMPPDRRAEALEDVRQDLKRRLAALEDDANPDERKRLEKALEKLEKQGRKGGDGEAGERPNKGDKLNADKEMEGEGKKPGEEQF
ncbi:MAG: hypothetical protein L6R28_13040 [Planctomycetes bacterium]|nr:hypothetical protein [Planctomycetota bacterium]